MPKIIAVPTSETETQLQFFCPACKMRHAVTTQWEFNNNFEIPTLYPSIKVSGHKFVDPENDENRDTEPFVCHSHVRFGNISFEQDCTHEYKGKTVALPNITD